MKKTVSVSFIIWIAISSVAFISCKKDTSLVKEIKTIHEIEQLLHLSSNTKDTFLTASYQLANKALMLAQRIHNDSLISKAYFVLGSNLRLQGKTEDAITLFQHALQLSIQLKDNKGICQALIDIGEIKYKKGEYEASGKLFKDALSLAQQNHYANLEATALNFIGKYYHTTGRFAESVIYYKQAIARYKQQGQIMQSASVLLSLGKTYNNEGNLFMALKSYLDAYKTCENTNDYINIADACNHLGSVYLALKQPLKAMEYHRKALAYRMVLNTPEGLAISFNNIGKVFLELNKPDSAHSYFVKSLYNCEQIAYAKGKVKALTNLGKVYNQLSKPVVAQQYLTQAYTIAYASGYDAGMAESSIELGNVLLLLHQPDSAKKAFEIGLVKARTANLSEHYQHAYWGIYQYYITVNNTAQALHYHVLYAQAENKELLAENNHQLVALRVTVESEKKEKDNEVLRKDNELKAMTIMRKNALMWLMAIAFISTVILSILLYSRFNNKRKANQRLERLNNKIVKQNKELETLNKKLEKANREKDKIFSIIAHELRNPLYWFQNLTETLSLRYHTMPAEKVQKSLTSLDESAKNAFHLMDNLLHWSRSRLNRITPKFTEQSLEKLITESSRMYQTIIQQKNITLIQHLPSDVYAKVDADLFTCVVRNLVSNAIKFTPENGTLTIQLSPYSTSHYQVSISDSGMGISFENSKHLFNLDIDYTSKGLMNEQGSGLGLKLCKEFVEMNGGQIWLAHTNNNGSCFCFTVPAHLSV